MMHKKYTILTCLISAMAAQAVTAQERECDTRLDCLQKEYEEKKFDETKFSSLKFIAGVKDTVSFNDNIFRSASQTESDVINTLSPQARLLSNFDKHAVSLRLRADNNIYFSNSENNFTNVEAEFDGRYDINAHNALHSGAAYRLEHVTIGSFVDDPLAGSSEPTPYHNGEVYLHYDGDYANWHYGTGVDWNIYNYENVDRNSGLPNIQNDRDRSEYSGNVHLGYRVHDDAIVYVKGIYEMRTHNERIDSSALFTRNSDGIRTLVGVRDEDRTDGLTYDIAVGYLKQDYDAMQMPDVNTFDAYADVRWNVTQADGVRFRLDRRIRDAYSTGVSAYVQTRARLDYEHEYNDRLEVGTGVSYARNDFETNESLRSLDRRDNVVGLRVWGEYEIIEDLDIELFYLYNDRSSNESRAVYDANIVGTSLSYKY